MQQNKHRIHQNVIDSSAQFGKVPPQATELEEVVLGAAMLETAGVEILIRIISSPEVFYSRAHQIIMQAIIDLYAINSPVDILTVTEQVRKIGELESVGGPYYISQLTSRIASAENIETHIRIIQEKYFQREIILLSAQLTALAYDDTQDAFDTLDAADHGIQRIIDLSTSGSTAESIGALVEKSIKSLDRREQQAKSGKLSGVNTGLKELNRRTQGWQPSDLIVLASRPGMGKTASMLFFAISAAKSGNAVCIYSLEMSAVRLSDRLILSVCDISVDRFRSGFINDEDRQELEKAKEQLKHLPIYVDDNPVVTMRYIRSHARMMQRRGKCTMIMVDYLQLADMRLEEKGRNREQEVAQTSRAAKIVAKTLRVPFLLLSQLSRSVEKRGGDMRPMLSDLRESGAIEQDADLVIFIHRPAYYGVIEDSAGTSTIGVMEYIITKNREGALGTVVLKHNESLTKIFDYNHDLDPVPAIDKESDWSKKNPF